MGNNANLRNFVHPKILENIFGKKRMRILNLKSNKRNNKECKKTLKNANFELIVHLKKKIREYNKKV